MSERSSPSSFARWQWIFASCVTLAILWLHIHFWQHAGGLWRDEVNTIYLAQTHSFAAMTHDSFPILMPALVDAWESLGLGGTDSGLRFGGMLLGLCIPAAFWAVARSTRRPPLFSLVLFGLNSLFIFYGDSLRAYGIGSALIVLCVATVWSLLKQPSWCRAALVALTATISVQALYQNAVLFFAICLAAFAVCWRRKDLATAVKLVCAGCVAAVSLLPYYTNFTSLSGVSVELRRGFSPLITSLNYIAAAGFPFEEYAGVWKMLAVIVVGLAVLLLARERSSPAPPDSSLALFAGVMVVTVLVSFFTFLWLAAVSAPPWYFIPPLALVVVCFDFGIPLPALPRLARNVSFGFLVVTALVAVPVAQSKLRAHFTNVDRLAAHVASQVSPDDYVIVASWYCGISFDRYYHAAAAWQTLPPLTSHATHRYDLLLAQMSNTNALVPVFNSISNALHSGHQVWVLGQLPTMRTNAMEPPLLPLPPLPGTGWADGPYGASWAGRTEYYLMRHGVHFEVIPDSSENETNIQESLRLYRATGWRD